MMRLLPPRLIPRLSSPKINGLLAAAGLVAATLLVFYGATRPSYPINIWPESLADRIARAGGLPSDNVSVSLDDDCVVSDWDAEAFQPSGISPYGDKEVSFTVRFQNESTSRPVILASAMPGETMSVIATANDGRAAFKAEAGKGLLTTVSHGQWRWQVPRTPGLYCITITDEMAGESVCINTFVLVPWDGSEILNGYRIGSYREPLNDNPAYGAPRGFIEVTPQNEGTWVSPHFQLRQFVCKQPGGYPKYLLLRTRLLLKLEILIDELKDRGVHATSFYVLSGYRTPWYNGGIDGAATNSRHTFGDAADILVDVNRNAVFDDLDKNGAAGGSGDVWWLRGIVDALVDQAWYRPYIGGFGLYEPIPGHRSAFAHIDTRGNLARWIGTPVEDDSTDADSVMIDSVLVNNGKQPKDTATVRGKGSESQPARPGVNESEDVEEIEEEIDTATTRNQRPRRERRAPADKTATEPYRVQLPPPPRQPDTQGGE